MSSREDIFLEWLKAKGKAKGLQIPKKTRGIFFDSMGYVHVPTKLQVLAKEIIELGERDGELGIQAMLLLLQGAKRNIHQLIPDIHSALDTIAIALGYETRNELMEFFKVPEVRKLTDYDSTTDKTFDEKIEDLYGTVLNIIQKVRPGIQMTLPRLAELAKAPKKFVEDIILSILEKKPLLGEYLQLEQVFIREENTEEIIDELISQPLPRYGHFHCSKCQEIIENRTANTCPSCGEKILRCIVCKLPILAEESIGKCSLCEGVAHLSHLQEWMKTQGNCPRCLQISEIIVVRKIEPVPEETLAFGINLSGIRIVNSGEWKDVPDGSKIDDVQGFFNMLFATDEKKLYLWHRGKNYSIGFFEHGKFFIHEMMKFDSVKEYLIAVNYGFSTPEKLFLHREALKHGWENREIAVAVWHAINKNYFGFPVRIFYAGGESEYHSQNNLRNHPLIREQFEHLFPLILQRGLIFEMLPPFSEDVLFGEDWYIWFFAYHNGWESFGKLREFAKEHLPNFQNDYNQIEVEAKDIKEKRAKSEPYFYDFELNKKRDHRGLSTPTQRSSVEIIYLDRRNDRFLKLFYLAIHGPFESGDAWLKGWPSFENLIDFWKNTDGLRNILENREKSIRNLRNRIQQELLLYKEYPAVIPYDSSILTKAKDWIPVIAEMRNWSEEDIEILKNNL